MAKILIYIVVLITTVNSQVYNTVSPDKNIKISFRLDEKGTAQYSVSSLNDDIDIIEWSDLGLNFKGSGLLMSNLKVISVKRTEIDETYRIISGKSKYARDFCNETEFLLEENKPQGRKLEIIFRAYNDGAAFRYGIPEQAEISDFIISTEETYFNFSNDYRIWSMKKDKFRHSYEGEYYEYNVSDLFTKPEDPLYYADYSTLPITFEVNQTLFFTLTEAAITDYAGMYIVKGNGNFSLKSKLSPDTVYKDISVRSKTPAVSPWRVIIIGNHPGDLIKSTIITSLNEPSKVPDAEIWVKPGKTMWSWWAEDRGFEPSFGYSILANNTVKYYIDFAAENNIEYVILDGGWYGWFDATRDDALHDITKSLPELDLPLMSQYAQSKNVGLILWVVWYELERQFEEALDYYQKLGIKGIKVDFMDRDDQFMVDFYHRVAEACAKRKMIVMYHGAYKPDGLERTYPNILTYEGVLGNEYSRWNHNYPNPDHNVKLAFTRMITGPMDFTPGSMTNVTKENYIARWKHPMTLGTRVHQMALTVIFQSGVLSLCESPKIYENLPEFDFIKQVPATWDSTIVLDGKIGEYVVIARKKGNDWFIGGITNWNSRVLNIKFDFLNNSEYKASIYQDSFDADVNPQNVTINNFIMTKESVQNFFLSKGGGLAIILEKIN